MQCAGLNALLRLSGDEGGGGQGLVRLTPPALGTPKHHKWVHTVNAKVLPTRLFQSSLQ